MTEMTDPRTDEPDDDQRPMASVLMAGLPITRLDPIRRLHVLSAAIPGAVVREQLIPAPFAAVWEEISDLERAVPASEWHVRSLRITERHGERLTADVENVIGLHDEFAIVLRPGWCWMEGWLLVAGMAAVADPAGTRLAWAAGLRLPGARLARPLLRRSLDRSLRRTADMLTPPDVDPEA